MDLKFFDANACFGSETVNHEVVNHERFIVLERVAVASTAAELIEYMDYAGIDRALVWHKSMYEQEPVSGNANIMMELRGHESRLVPSWTILPSITDREFDAETFFGEMAKNGVRALRAFPETNRYFLCGETMREQLDMITELKIPLFLEPRYGFEGIYSVLREFPKLTVVLCNIGCWPSARYVYPLLKNYDNFYFETGDFGMLRGFEEICSRFGSHRMLFGTNFPTNNMACGMNMLIGAGISEEAKNDIAHRNLERLIDGVRL